MKHFLVSFCVIIGDSVIACESYQVIINMRCYSYCRCFELLLAYVLCSDLLQIAETNWIFFCLFYLLKLSQSDAFNINMII